ncbi:MAG: AbrB/MazE/SpoVT family DNA-binding domain-containing protein [Rhizobiaceae bacterium]|jgi:AbrB family looped-hinge helix DNA binding protein|nr:AbrB/MazE/SpoVT family DNA-binding domain-containing protein [Rhizobiaceae bacterium]MBO6724102.1 AbrB/MazE/SpoVT family DNA-binding domain-containing protein [Rhizobiaceae bacterium]
MNAPLDLDGDGLSEKVKIAANGRMVLPKSMRNAVGIEGETELVLTIKDGQIQISTIADRIREAREIFRKSVKRPFSSDDFLATRERD